MKHLIKRSAGRMGLHAYSDDSLPTGVNWLHDIRRSGLIGARPLCFDVGANVGQTVLEIRRSFADAIVHAFEPFAAPFEALEQLARSMSDVKPVRLALGALPGRIDVQPREHSVLNSLVPREQGACTTATESIRIDTIDRYCGERGVERIDILKTDTEGYDLDVLQGADSMLKDQRVSFVHAEVTFEAANRQNTPFLPLFEWLTRHHAYRFLGLYETFPLHHFDEPNLFCNALFVSADARQRALAARSARESGPSGP